MILDASFAEGDIEGISFAELFFCGNVNIESLKINLNKYYEVEMLIDENKVLDIPERINEPIPNEWIVDRYKKRALCSSLNSIGKRRRGKALTHNTFSKVNITQRMDGNNPNSQTFRYMDYKNDEDQENSYIHLPSPRIPKFEYDLISAYCSSLPNMTRQDWAELAFIEKLHNDKQISDDEFIYRHNEICTRLPRGKRKGTKTKLK